MISVIVPIYNEEQELIKHTEWFKGFPRQAELIFVDGGSLDKSVAIASCYGRVLNCGKGRAVQMNYGASQAKGDILLFLHADNIISADILETIERKVFKDGYIGGCFTQRIDNKAFIYRLIEWQGNVRARMTRDFYGDQGIFVRKDMFLKIGGFPEVPIMEDVLFTKQLRKMGQTVVLPDKIMVSARRWEKKGIIKTTIFFNLIIILFWLKVPLYKIKQLYEDIR